MTDGSMIRLTVSRYYTPSGRCIQKPYDKGHGEEYQLDLLNRYNSGELWHADSIARPDSLMYRTLKNKRPVYGGGGIIPDVFVPVDTTYYSPYYRSLIGKNVLNRCVIDFVEANRASLKAKYRDYTSFQDNFEIPETLLQDLVNRGTAAGVEYDAEQWERSKPIIEAIMMGLLTRDLYEDGSYFRPISRLNPDFQEALRLINDAERYNSLISAPQGGGQEASKP